MAIIKRVIDHYAKSAISIDDTDGVSVSFENWRFNLRVSNTEPLVRLNVETVGDEELLQNKLSEIEGLLN